MFYVLAALIVLAAVASILAPSTRLVLLAVMAVDVLVGLLLIAAGAYMLGSIAVVAPALCLLAVAVLLNRSGYAPLLADIPGRPAGWPLAAAVAVGLGVLLVWVGETRIDDVASATSGQNLVTLLHYRTPVTLGVGAILAVVAIGGAVMIGRTGEDERVLDLAAEHRRLREQRGRLRREARAAARAQQAGSRGSSR